MAYAPVISTTKRAAGSGATTITTAAIDTSGADLIVLIGAGTSAAPNMSDNKGNTWTACGTNSSAVAFFCQAPTVGSGHTFTFNPGTGNPSMVVLAFSGSVASPLDQFSFATATQPGSTTPSVANCLVVTYQFAVYTNNTTSCNAPFGGTEVIAAGNGDTWQSAAAYEIQTTATARNPTWTVADATGIETGIVSFKAAAGGGGGGTTYSGCDGTGCFHHDAALFTEYRETRRRRELAIARIGREIASGRRAA